MCHDMFHRLPALPYVPPKRGWLRTIITLFIGTRMYTLKPAGWPVEGLRAVAKASRVVVALCEVAAMRQKGI